MKASIEAQEKANLIAKAAFDKKAEDIVIMDMRAVSNVTDYFVLCSAPSARRAQTIAHGVKEALIVKGIRNWHTEGKKEAFWVLIDYGDVIVHIFHERMREFYNLERLWHDAPKERFSPSCILVKSKKI